jgi:hypothetical protein
MTLTHGGRPVGLGPASQQHPAVSVRLAGLVCVYDHCDQLARPYLCGPRCADHTPAREHGHLEAPPLAGRPWWVDASGHPLPLSPLSASWVHDSRAVASGRRVSGVRRKRAHAGERYDASTSDGR